MLRRCLSVAALSLVLPLAPPAHAQPATAPDCTADVDRSGGDGLKLAVVYRCRAAGPVTFNATGEKMASRVMEFTDSAGKPLQRSAASWWVEPVNGVAEARYRFDLMAFAQETNNVRIAVARGGGVLSLIEAWLLEPRGLGRPPVIDIRVKAADGLSFTTGLPKVGDAWRLSDTWVRFAGYSAIGKFALQEVPVPVSGSLRAGQAKEEGVLRIAMLDGFSEEGRGELVDWIRRTAEAESNYWQGFTANQMMIGLVPFENRRGVGFGRTVPGGGATLMVEVGANVDRHRLFGEWVLVHELIHTGMPYITNRGTWLMEGAATYVEPIIRARAGWKREPEVWKEWIANMPRGAAAFTAGLANASGQQNYWGGAIFMLMADLGIRRATKGAKGLEDCLRGALWSGLDATRRVTVNDFALACDRASQTDVVSELVQSHFVKGKSVDLDRLWKQLGVSEVGGNIVFDDKAPDAQWRKMIVPGPPDRPPQRVKLPWQS